MYLRIEIDVMARLNHPFLVNLNYSFQTPHAAFMVLDLVSGGDLEHFQRRFKGAPPTEEMTLTVALNAADPADYASFMLSPPSYSAPYFASAAGALCVQTLGAMPSMPSLEATERLAGESSEQGVARPLQA